MQGNQGSQGGQGPQGLQGSQGSQGTQGLQGSQGAQWSAQGTIVATNSTQSTSNNGSVSVACPATHPYALGGGFAGSTTDAYYMYISRPVFTAGSAATGWQYSWGGAASNAQRTYTVYAICSK